MAGAGVDYGFGWGRDGPWMWMAIGMHVAGGTDRPWMWLEVGMYPGCRDVPWM